jgi:PBP1b-binding outer membrane lipoprotein LpoB
MDLVKRRVLMKRGLAAACAAMFLAGCATTTAAGRFDPATVATFQPGVTTIAQVETALGPPYQSMKMPDGTQQLQYISKVQDLSADDTPTTGSAIHKRTTAMVSTMLTFDQSGHFLSSSSNSTTQGNNN